MTRTEQLLWDWHVEHYGSGIDAPATYRKLLEEVGELGEALMVNDGEKCGHDVVCEIADVAILSFMLLQWARPGMTLGTAMHLKYDIIKERSDARIHRQKPEPPEEST